MKSVNNLLRAYPDSLLLIPLVIFSGILIPFLPTIPYLDGNIDFVQTSDFYIGGMQRYFQEWGSVHPPVKLILSWIFYRFFGIHSWDYNIVGLLLGLLGITTWYYFCKQLTNRYAAFYSSLLLATCPMFLATSIFVLRDQMILVFVVYSLYLYQKEKFILYGLIGSLLVLTKETALLLPMAVFFIELVYLKITLKRQAKQIFSRLFIILPIITFFLWLYYLNLNHQKPWSDWLFAPTADKGTFYTIFYNLTTFSFLNPYGYQQWLHLFVLNFNWFFWLLTISGVVIFFVQHRKKQIRHILFGGTPREKSFLILLLFFAGYFFSVLTIQTYTIPRYILPMLPLMYLLASYGIDKQKFLLKEISIGLVSCVIIAQLFFSIDPLSKLLWGETVAFDQTLYGLNNALSGNDGITYNMQYVFLAKRRSDILTAQVTPKIDSSSCMWLLKDPNNDNKTISILHLEDFSYASACIIH